MEFNAGNNGLGTVELIVLLFPGLAALTIAIWEVGFKRWIYKPVLNLVNISKHARQEIPTRLVELDPNCSFSCSAQWYRLGVRNDGKECAENVEVLITDILRVLENGTAQTIEGFIPTNFTWTHLDDKFFMPQIPRKTSKSLTLGYVLNHEAYDRIRNRTINNLSINLPPDPGFILAVLPKPENDFYVIYEGRYIIDITIAAKNSAPFPFRIILNLNKLDADWNSIDFLDINPPKKEDYLPQIEIKIIKR